MHSISQLAPEMFHVVLHARSYSFWWFLSPVKNGGATSCMMLNVGNQPTSLSCWPTLGYDRSKKIALSGLSPWNLLQQLSPWLIRNILPPSLSFPYPIPHPNSKNSFITVSSIVPLLSIFITNTLVQRSTISGLDIYNSPLIFILVTLRFIFQTIVFSIFPLHL